MRIFIVNGDVQLVDEAKVNLLNKLNGEDIIGTGLVHLYYPYLDWRAKVYVLARNNSYEEQEIIDAIGEHFKAGAICYLSEYYKAFVVNQKLRARCKGSYVENYFVDCEHTELCSDETVKWHLPSYCSYGGDVNVAVQVAQVLGYSEIYLVNCTDDSIYPTLKFNASVEVYNTDIADDKTLPYISLAEVLDGEEGERIHTRSHQSHDKRPRSRSKRKGDAVR